MRLPRSGALVVAALVGALLVVHTVTGVLTWREERSLGFRACPPADSGGRRARNLRARPESAAQRAHPPTASGPAPVNLPAGAAPRRGGGRWWTGRCRRRGGGGRRGR